VTAPTALTPSAQHQRFGKDTTIMADTTQPTDNEIDIDKHRGELICAIAGAINALTRASGSLAALASNEVYDIEFTEGATGGDLAAFLDDSLRFARAAYLLTREVVDGR